MMLNSELVALSEIDEARFGFKIARAPRITLENLDEVLDFCHEKQVRMLIARCPTHDLSAAQTMERAGFQIMDTLVYYSYNLTRKPIPELAPSSVSIRPIRPGEEKLVQAIAADAFRGYYSHYHADPRIDAQKADDAYTSWAVRACTSKDVADGVLVAELDGEVVAFTTIQINPQGEGHTPISGVTSSAQGQGIHRLLMIHRMRWFAAHNVERMVVSTQITNLAIQKSWCRAGFEPSHSSYTFHK